MSSVRRSSTRCRTTFCTRWHDARRPAPADPAIELDEAERRATARAIDEEAERMNRLVDSLLNMSRIQSGAL